MDARVDRIGRLGTPIVTIEAAVGDPDIWRAQALRSDWAPRGDFYPGPRAEAPHDYLHALAEPLRLALGGVFGWRSPVDVIGCFYSLATTPAADLIPEQRAPHVDSFDPDQVAFVHFLCDARFGGTAFYRQRSTGFERIDTGNCTEFERVRTAGTAQLQRTPSDYIGAGNPHFEQLLVCPAAFNRIVLFPSNLLHCADLSGVALDPDPAHGRLTVAGFLRPQH